MSVGYRSPCFTPGTLIATERGRLPVEYLRRGDRVVTRDNGLKRISWVGQRTLSYKDIKRDKKVQPILVRAGTFGEGRPHRDMIVSPDHRFLVSSDLTPLTGGKDEALVAARHLMHQGGVSRAQMLGVSYIHFLCHSHEVVLADGAWTESFHPDDQIMKNIAPQQRREILSLFPEIATVGASRRFPPVRPIKKSHFET